MAYPFPIHSLRNEIQEALRKSNRLILKAPTGSGKSTRVPQFMLDDLLSDEGQVLVLQPRRIAARLLARFIAGERKGQPGEEVGYQLRLDSCKSAITRILFVTEGILLRRLLSGDPLSEVKAIIFDEFHERHLETDLSLGLSLELQKSSRPDLKIIVMSATLETTDLTNYLTPCPVLETSGRTYPVEVSYLPPSSNENAWDTAIRALTMVLGSWKEGSALVFMPGIFEIRKTIDLLKSNPRFANFIILPLHGSLNGHEQDEAVREGDRKVIVTTNVAETSITIPDVRLVIDSGTARVARFDARRGIDTLYTEPISRSSADQRAGRAGRTGPGSCIRLWSEFSHATRNFSDLPEVMRVDLSETILGLLAKGYQDLKSFPWLQKPADNMIRHSMDLLSQLGAIDKSGEITALGRRMSRLTMHPRFSRLLTLAEELECLPAASVLAALAQGSGILWNSQDPFILGQREVKFGGTGSDLLFEMNAWLWASSVQFKKIECDRFGINASVARQTGLLALQILRMTTGSSRHQHKLPVERLSVEEEADLKKCILVAFSDFLAVRHRKESDTCQMMNGKGAQLSRESTVRDARIMVASELEEKKTSGGMQLVLKKVTAIEEDWLHNLHLSGWEERSSVRFDEASKRVIVETEECLNGLVVWKKLEESQDPEQISQVLLKEILEKRIPFPQWDEKTQAKVNRINFASRYSKYIPVPVLDEEAKLFVIQQAIYHCKTLKDIQRVDLIPALRDYLNADQWREVNRLAPESIQLPLRKRPTFLRYEENGEVILSETVQALYDCPADIRIADGQARLKFEILSPARRPVQITSDLEQFWKTSYLEVKKELKGRYPKHEWR